jgi:hypothetical protein
MVLEVDKALVQDMEGKEDMALVEDKVGMVDKEDKVA